MIQPLYIKKIHKVWKLLLDLIFPQFCVGCDREGSVLCRQCEQKIIPVKTQVCPQCLRLSQNGHYCSKCRKGKSLTGIVVSAYYEEGPIKEMIHYFKYNHCLNLKKSLTKVMIQALPHNEIDIITFTPLHRRRLAERGYNQAQILAEEIARVKKIKCLALLVKTKSTKRQVGLTAEKRKRNLKNVFEVKQTFNLKNKNILIIDDVTTTGTTLEECARILKQYGAKSIHGLVIARG